MTTIIYGFLWIIGVALGCVFLMIAVICACWAHSWLDTHKTWYARQWYKIRNWRW